MLDTPPPVPAPPEVRVGDVVLRRIPGGPPYRGVLRSDTLTSARALAAAGISVEPAGPGFYAAVEETSPHGPRIVGRRITDGWGRLPRGQILHPADAPGDLARISHQK